jgi:diguanylate cyclase (GGDEF)-like protein
VGTTPALESAVRGGDAAARFGGEEFALLLSEGGKDRAAAVIERLRRSWEKTNPRTTFSDGIAVRRRNETIGHALRRADAALYAAKDAGRNRIEIASLIVA